MRRRVLRLPAWIAATFGAATLARADAPGNQYDGYSGSCVTITDAKTGLTWQRFPPAGLYGYADGASYCSGLGLAPTCPPTPSATWRLPSYKELLTLVDESPHVNFVTGATVAIDPNAFPDSPMNAAPVDAPYMTSSLAKGSSSVYVVSFTDGSATAAGATQTGFRVRCVTP